MKITAEMNLGQLANVAAQHLPHASDWRLVRTLLLLAKEGGDTDDLSKADWSLINRHITRQKNPIHTGAEVDRVFHAGGIHFFHWNKKTNDWTVGFQGSTPIGDRALDRAWVFFEVGATAWEEALQRAKEYVAAPNAKFTDRMVSIKDRRAFVGARSQRIDF
jgi:hypothetical protein